VSRFFDLLQILNHRAAGVKVASNGHSANASITTGTEVDRTLSVLLSADAAVKPAAVTAVASTVSQADDGCAADSLIQEIPSVQVEIHAESRIIAHSTPRGPGADRFRLLRMRLRELRKTKELRTVLITSSLPGEGKSTVALNLATTLAEGGQRPVLLLEADLHRSPLIHQLGLSERPGLAECLENGVNPLSVINKLDPLDWYFLPAGKSKTTPTELLQGDALANVIRELTPHFEWILIDSPPVTALTDALSIGRHAQGTLVVVRAGRTQQDDVERAIELVGKQNIVAILLNGVEGLNDLYSRYSTYYGQN